ncbi:MAG: sulfurtransferase-like selenium metabolism protein YedF [Syntrophus sp. (in: bacteria)]|nr:sulfurtransferase-like selenium metabolism protein YedF [Syntrophus sp. (in: bacteria)]
MEYLDLKGMNCPLPVIETKKCLESKDVEEIEVILDNFVSTENVNRFLTSHSFVTTTEQKGDTYYVRGALSGKRRTAPVELKKVLIFVDGETMGKGNEELGKVLMGAFLKTLKELEIRPWRLILINSGVKLVSQGSEYIEILKELESTGVEIISCGTCLDFFDLQEKVGAGRISNMFEILSSFTEATNVIRP